MYKAIAILGEDVWEIILTVGEFESKEKAEYIAGESDLNMKLVIENGNPAIVATVDGEQKFFFDKDIEIKEISKEKQAIMGEPIDITAEGALDKIYASIGDPAYTVTADDMVISNKTLADFIRAYREGYKPDHIGYSVE
jgi:hypothetical protein